MSTVDYLENLTASGLALNGSTLSDSLGFTADYLENLTASGLALNGSTLSDSLGIITDHLVVFRGFVITIGLFGSFMNGVVLSVLLSKKLRSKPTYLLIINQVVLDFLSCLFLLPSYALKVHTIYLGRWGKFICVLFFWDTSVFSFQAGSVTNLVLIAVERYVKIVHVVFHRTYYKRWMSLAGLGFIWTTVLVLDVNLAWAIEVVDGACYANWPGGSFFLAYGIFITVWEFVIPLILFVYLYGHILLFIRQRSKTLTESNTNQATATSLQTSAQRSQMNITMTMIIVSTTFVMLRLPNQLYYLLAFVDFVRYTVYEVYYATVFLMFLNVCTNPLIYAAKHEEVKKRIKKWFFKAKVQPEVSTAVFTVSEAA